MDDEKIHGEKVVDLIGADELVPGLQFRRPAFRGVVEGAVVLVKVLDEDGDYYWFHRISAGVSTAEAAGALHLQLARITDQWCGPDPSRIDD